MDRVATLMEMLKNNPEDGFLLHALALEYVKKGEDIRAEEIFTTLLEKQPEYIGAYYHLGKLYERAGRDGEAASIYGKGMQYAEKAREMHAFGELKSAYEFLTF